MLRLHTPKYCGPFRDHKMTSLTNWLITVHSSISVEEVLIKLTEFGCQRDPRLEPIELGSNERSIPILGPKDLPKKIRSNNMIDVIDIYNNSNYDFHN